MMRKPLTMAQVRWHHRVWFSIATLGFFYLLILTLEVLCTATTSFGFQSGLGCAVASVFLWHVVRRRWRRMREAK